MQSNGRVISPDFFSLQDRCEGLFFFFIKKMTFAKGPVLKDSFLYLCRNGITMFFLLPVVGFYSQHTFL